MEGRVLASVQSVPLSALRYQETSASVASHASQMDEMRRDIDVSLYERKMLEFELKVAKLEGQVMKMGRDEERLEYERKLMQLEMEKVKRDGEELARERELMKAEEIRMEESRRRFEADRLKWERERLEQEELRLLASRQAGVNLFHGARNVNISGNSAFNVYWGSMAGASWISLVDATGEEYHLPEYFTSSFKTFIGALELLFQRDTWQALAQREFVEKHAYDLVIERHNEIVPINDEATWSMVEKGTKLVMRVILWAATVKETRGYRCPLPHCRTWNCSPIGHTALVIDCRGCHSRFQISELSHADENPTSWRYDMSLIKNLHVRTLKDRPSYGNGPIHRFVGEGVLDDESSSEEDEEAFRNTLPNERESTSSPGLTEGSGFLRQFTRASPGPLSNKNPYNLLGFMSSLQVDEDSEDDDSSSTPSPQSTTDTETDSQSSDSPPIRKRPLVKLRPDSHSSESVMRGSFARRTDTSPVRGLTLLPLAVVPRPRSLSPQDSRSSIATVIQDSGG